jgi:CheY-like chemotaxis protein
MIRVLVVDDDPFVLRAVAGLLARVASVRTVASGDLALHALEHDAFDAILTDLEMPLMNGLTLLEIVRRRWPSVRRLLMSGSVDAEIDLSDPRLDAFLAKPFDASELREALAA